MSTPYERHATLGHTMRYCAEIDRGTDGQTRQCSDHSTSGWGAR